MSTILNVLGKIPEYLRYSTVTQDQLQRGELPGAPPPSKAKKAKDEAAPDPDANWRQELYELSRRFQGLPSTEEAERRLAALETEIESRSGQFEAESKHAYEASTTPFLSAWDKTQIDRKIAALNEAMEDFRKNVRCKLAQAKALVETCRTWNPKRSRYEELRKRQQAIDAAVAGTKRDKAFDAADTIRRPGPVDRLTF